LLVIYNHGDISIPSFIRYHLTIARFSRTIESWNGLMVVSFSPCCLDFIKKSVPQALFKLPTH
ncbi:hypothetical protein RLC89_05310, partial [Streptococcus pneumoniae]|nr:hypothetical protein [Streptococcus pneumoniae]MDS2573378.1 hypothetical protein [Streptococcus pneumoniae]MDS2652458.1 hypothetical protein [Streptococcus pneumoniae]MDS2763655.1 hypothetical protein [Streptococcus pneumoniae]MDS3356213.1 hypothetical protein [Streptococcus pneumoniae]